jgi:hypothetical protein
MPGSQRPEAMYTRSDPDPDRLLGMVSEWSRLNPFRLFTATIFDRGYAFVISRSPILPDGCTGGKLLTLGRPLRDRPENNSDFVVINRAPMAGLFDGAGQGGLCG